MKLDPPQRSTQGYIQPSHRDATIQTLPLFTGEVRARLSKPYCLGYRSAARWATLKAVASELRGVANEVVRLVEVSVSRTTGAEA